MIEREPAAYICVHGHPHYKYIYVCVCVCILAGARGVMVIIVGNEHSDTSSNPGRDWLHFT